MCKSLTNWSREQNKQSRQGAFDFFISTTMLSHFSEVNLYILDDRTSDHLDALLASIVLFAVYFILETVVWRTRAISFSRWELTY